MEKNNRKKFTNKIVTNVTWLLILVVIALYFGVYYSVKNIGILKNQIIESKIETEKKLSREQNMGNLVGKIKKIENDMQLLDESFVKNKGELEFITVLENIADYNRIKQSINLMPPVQTDLLNESIVNISARGTYPDIMNYLRDLESVKYYLVISNLNLTKQNDAQNQIPEQLVNLTLNAKIYWKNYEYKD